MHRTRVPGSPSDRHLGASPAPPAPPSLPAPGTPWALSQPGHLPRDAGAATSWGPSQGSLSSSRGRPRHLRVSLFGPQRPTHRARHGVGADALSGAPRLHFRSGAFVFVCRHTRVGRRGPGRAVPFLGLLQPTHRPPFPACSPFPVPAPEGRTGAGREATCEVGHGGWPCALLCVQPGPCGLTPGQGASRAAGRSGPQPAALQREAPRPSLPGTGPAGRRGPSCCEAQFLASGLPRVGLCCESLLRRCLLKLRRIPALAGAPIPRCPPTPCAGGRLPLRPCFGRSPPVSRETCRVSLDRARGVAVRAPFCRWVN